MRRSRAGWGLAGWGLAGRGLPGRLLEHLPSRRLPPARHAPVPTEDAVLQVACHELRTPVAALRALAAACRRQDGLSEKERDEALGLVEAHAEHLLALLAELREHAELLHAAAATPTDVRLPDLIVAAAAAGGLPRERLDLRCPAETVRLDATAVRQLLTNLVENCCRYADPAAAVVILAERGRGGLALTVTDAPAPRPVPRRGSGLGAGIVEQLAARLGGRVETCRTPAGGRSVRVEVPLQAGPGRVRTEPRRLRSGAGTVGPVLGPF